MALLRCDALQTRWALSILASLLVFGTGCRNRGFYDPIYNETQVAQLLRDHHDQLQKIALSWAGQYEQLEIQIQPRNRGRLWSVSRLDPEEFGTPQCSAIVQINSKGDVLVIQHHSAIASGNICGLSGTDANPILRLCQNLKIDSIGTLVLDARRRYRYVMVTFQGGGHGPREWPYGLIYIPTNEPLNLLNSSNGGPGPGFSRLDNLGGRWLYFESSGS